MPLMIKTFPVPTTSDGATNPVVTTPEIWSLVTISKETAGNIAISTDKEIVPLASRKGLSLASDFSTTFIAPPGSQVFAGADADGQRIGVIMQPLPLDLLTKIFYDALVMLCRSGIPGRIP